MPPVFHKHQIQQLRQARRPDPVKVNNKPSELHSYQQKNYHHHQSEVQSFYINSNQTRTQVETSERRNNNNADFSLERQIYPQASLPNQHQIAWPVIPERQHQTTHAEHPNLLPTGTFPRSNFQTPLQTQPIQIDPQLIQYDVQQADHHYHRPAATPQIDPQLFQEANAHPFPPQLLSEPTPKLDPPLLHYTPPPLTTTPLTPTPTPQPSSQPMTRVFPLGEDKKVHQELSSPPQQQDQQNNDNSCRKTKIANGAKAKKGTTLKRQKKIIEEKPQQKQEQLRTPPPTTPQHPQPVSAPSKKRVLEATEDLTKLQISSSSYSPDTKPKHKKQKNQSAKSTLNSLQETPIQPEYELRAYLNSIITPPRQVLREEMLRAGTFLFDQLLSHAFSRPFVNPEAEDAVIYRSVIKDLMDLTTAEQKLWARKYKTPNDLYIDICQIMFNAFAFHRDKGVIYEEAKLMAAHFKQLVPRINAYLYGGNIPDPIKPEQLRLPHEEFRLSKVNVHIGSPIYILPTMTFEEINKKTQRFNHAAAERLDPLSRPLHNIFIDKNLRLLRFDASQQSRNFVRIYLAGGRNSLEKCRDDPDAILAILGHIHWEKLTNKLRCKALITKPFGRRHDLDTLDFPELNDARAWIRCAIVDRVDLDLEVSSKFYNSCVRALYNVVYYEPEMMDPHLHEAFLVALRLPQQNDALPENKNIWKSLCMEADSCDVPFEDFQSLGNSITIEAEGFFKRVFHVQNDENIVVQNFKEISDQTLGTRIAETVCCLKTKGLENTGQILKIYKEKENELVGLAMKRYEQTLKEYAFNSRRLLTAEQKYKLILDMANGIRSIHGAGFAHRDLSEVNMMVTEKTNEKLSDGSIKPELVIIDFGKAVFVKVQDVRRWSVGDTSDETIDILPLIWTVPDHGYKLYRSIATLPRSKNDTEVLPQPIDPLAEDMYSLGILIWRIFSGQAPWSGILDTDIKALRAIVSDVKTIAFEIDKAVQGNMSRELLFRCITVDPQVRNTGEELYQFLIQDEVKQGLVKEWSALGGRARKDRKL